MESLPTPAHPAEIPMLAQFASLVPLWRIFLEFGILCTVVLLPVNVHSQQTRLGVVEGRVIAAEGEEPIPYGLVLLLPNTAEAPLQSVLSGADGRFRFTGVPPGVYRLRLDRIGFVSTPTPPFELGPGEVGLHTLTSTARPVELPGILVRLGPTGCYTAARLAQHPELHALWQEAQKGVAIRRGFEQQYVYRYAFHQVSSTDFRRRHRTEVRHDTVVNLIQNDPASAQTDRGKRNYATPTGQGLALRLPSEGELLAPEFLRRHCVESDLQLSDGAWELRFRPVRTQRSRIDLRGSIRVDKETLQVRGLVLEYVQGREPFFRAEIEYADVPLSGGVLRLPVSGSFTAQPTRGMRSAIERVQGVINFLDYEVVGSAAAVP